MTQGQWSTTTLRGSAAGWARELRAAGVTMNLAPVADTVPPNLVPVNAPIGRLSREYGNDPATVASPGAWTAGVASGYWSSTVG